jgi:hypothetical protein
LTIVTVPERHIKDFTPRKLDRGEELKTFFVPPATKYEGGKKVTHKGIIFYESGGSELETPEPPTTTETPGVHKMTPLRFCNKELDCSIKQDA